jgi:hypothetical protein
MPFFLQDGLRAQFLDADVKTSTAETPVLGSGEGSGRSAPRGEARGDSESRQLLEHAIDVGRGGLYLKLTLEQYRKLRNNR